LHEVELKKLQKDKEDIEAQKKANEWGSQIRSYVLHPYQLVKDHRTGWECGTPDKVLNGDLDLAIEAFLKSKLLKERPS
jgi:peptide chain release factor 2